MKRIITNQPDLREIYSRFLIIFWLILIIVCPITAEEETENFQSSSNQQQTALDPFVQVTNVSIVPSELMPNDRATVTLMLENTDKNHPVSVSDAGIYSKEVKVLTPTIGKVGVIGPGNRMPLTFTIEAGSNPGVVYPVFHASFIGSANYIRYPFPVTIKNSEAVISVLSIPEAWIEGKKNPILLQVTNLRDNPVTGVMIIPEQGIHTTLPSSHAAGNLDPGASILIPLNITPQVSAPFNVTLRYMNGINEHEFYSTIPITISSSTKDADLFISNLVITQEPDYLMVKGDVTNAGLENANAVVVTVKDPSEAVYPYKQYGVGLLKPSDFGSFQVTLNPLENASSTILTLSFKDSDGKISARDIPVNLTLQNPYLVGQLPDEQIPTDSLPFDLLIPVGAGILILGVGSGLVMLRKKRHEKNGVSAPEKLIGPTFVSPEPDLLSPSPSTLFSQGVELYQKKEWKPAAEIFHQIVITDPGYHRAWNAYGICLTQIGEYMAADECFANALRLSPKTRSYQKNREINANRLKAM